MLEQFSPALCPTSLPHFGQLTNPLTQRFSRFVSLGVAECTAIEAITQRRKMFKAGSTLVREGYDQDCVSLIISGVALRYRILPNGRRQIIGFLVPGDLCDTQFVILSKSDHNVGALCDTEVARISLSALMNAMVEYPKIERSLLMMSLIDAAIMREWFVNVAQRNAYQKLAHFFCEMSERFNAYSLPPAGGINIPLTQTDLADTMGLTVVHVNRVMQGFRREGLLNWSRHHFDVLDAARLKHLAQFDPAYLHLDGTVADPRMCAYG